MKKKKLCSLQEVMQRVFQKDRDVQFCQEDIGILWSQFSEASGQYCNQFFLHIFMMFVQMKDQLIQLFSIYVDMWVICSKCNKNKTLFVPQDWSDDCNPKKKKKKKRKKEKKRKQKKGQEDKEK
eukprot:TRINITY_DN3785_c0_g1_i1.p1 TRINITY_DN3785_c0_g1~~TRINITY_DN3785_c0_g1_i1.p1  ORF type:complete len:124 (-),score=6.98 TRINITY_DN3785_c0_g1_i1:40-411(-)